MVAPYKCLSDNLDNSRSHRDIPAKIINFLIKIANNCIKVKKCSTDMVVLAEFLAKTVEDN